MYPMATLPDDALLHNLAAGDGAAFTELYKRYWTSLYDAAYKRIESRQEAEDIVQEVYIRLWQRRQEVVIKDIGAWLHTAVRYGVLSRIARDKSSLTGFYEPFKSVLLEADAADSHLIAKELLEMIYAYADTLSARKKQIFLLFVKNKLSTREIAEELQISQKAVQNQLGTALHGLKTNVLPTILAVMAAQL